MRKSPDLGMMVLGHDFESCGLALVTSKREQLRPRQYLYLPAMMVTNANATHIWGDHAVRGNYNTVGTIKGNDNSHPLKTLFAFISG